MNCTGSTLHTKQGVTALILSGGGARAAYQVGVLQAIAQWLRQPEQNPFPVILGTSAGAINALGLACNAQHFSQGVAKLSEVWQQLASQQIYRTDWLGVLSQATSFIWQHLLGRGDQRCGMALLDNRPLMDFLQQQLDLAKIEGALTSKALLAVGVTAFAYGAGQSVTFYQSQQISKSWQRHRRIGTPQSLTYQHLMASTAIPLFFAPVALAGDHYGDGALRQVAPISPALHLGANRVLVIGVGNPEELSDQLTKPPSLAQVAGQLLNSTFTDNLENDLESLLRVNQFAQLFSSSKIAQQQAPGWELAAQPVDVCVISPSQNLDAIAIQYRRHLPVALRPFLSGTGASQAGGGGILSYLLFEAEYCRQLMALGYADAQAQQQTIKAFLYC